MAVWACPACGGENPGGTRFCGHCGSRADEASPDVADALRSFVVGTVADRLVEAGGYIPEERRLITALFADISGFTPLAARLDPEELLEVIDPVVSALSSIVGRYEGYVEKFAGDALLALFGAPVSHDDDAARALRVALEMHDELERIKAELPADAAGLTLHVGVNSGHGIARILGSEARMDYAVLGDAVILAQRLESAAPPGETYVSETTLRLAEHRFELEPVGALTLKGKSEPVPAWRLVGERATASRPGRARMVGRDRELDLLAATTGGVVTITGEPGVGKSRLLEEARALAAERGIRWLAARCLSYGAALPYWPFADLLRREEPPHDPFIARLLGRDAPALEPEAFRRGLHDAVGRWVDGSVLVLEDVHWLDSASQSLVAELARRPSLQLVLSGRPEAEEMLDQLAPERTRLVLTPLDEHRVDELIAATLGSPAPRGLAAFVGRRAGGNPFFVQELVRALQESRGLVHEGGRWRMRPGWDARELPPTIEEVLSARMDALSRTAAATLQTASVIGRRAPVELLAAAGGDPGALDELVAAGFLHEAQDVGSRVLVFHHALVQDAAYERLLRRKRRELHLRVAEQAEQLYGAGDDVIDLLARHLYLGGGAKAVEYLARAGARARRLYANEEAILHLARACELAPDDHELRLELADLHELVGNYDEALELYERVRDATADVHAWRGIAATLRKRGEYIEALAAVDQAFGDSALRGRDLSSLWLEGGWTLSLTGRVGAAVDVLGAGIETAPPGAEARGRLLVELARAHVAEGRLEDAVARAGEARELLEQRDDPRGLSAAFRVLGSAYLLLERATEAAEALREGLRLAERVGNIEEIGGCLINLGMVELSRGLHDAAADCNRRAIEEFERVGHGSGRAWGYSNLAWTLANAGRFDEALDECRLSLELSHAMGHTVTVAETLDTMAYVALRTGKLLEAAEHAAEAAALFVEIGSPPKAAEALERAAEAWARQGDAERAYALRTQARSLEQLVASG